MKCLKCDGELKVEHTTIEKSYCEVIFVCESDPTHKYLEFIDREALQEYDL